MEILIEINDVYLRREDNQILDGIHWKVNQGEHWVILGRNGSGKTTLLEMINGYLFPSQGTVRVLGNVYGQCDVREVRKQIGYISQSLLEKLALKDPVWEVVATGEYGYLRFYQDIPAELREKAEQVLQEIGLYRLRNNPLGSLSQGERKKVLLARALMTDPAILVMDEPCSGLDLYEREKLLDNMNGLARRNMTIIYVTHHIEEIMPIFTHVVLMNQGKIVAAGPKQSVLTPDHLISAYEVPIAIDWFEERPWVRVVRGTVS
jgi:iron complex transport system ATP-binding protein